MKKSLSLLLAAVMVLSLCVTALAESTSETVTVRLTGDAADQVVNLKDGQRVRANKDTTVRLNVQSDPGAAEYTVTLDGEPVEVDHSTSRYHFYYLPSEQLSAVSTLSVNAQSEDTEVVSIATADELKAFRDRVNNGETELNAVLTADIDLQKAAWTPIGTSSTQYGGTFDGDSHTITGLNVTGANNGLFKMTNGATIRNLTISDSTIATGGDYQNCGGAFVGLIKGNTTLINCHTTASVTVSGGAIGGLVGGASSSATSIVLTLDRCSNAATVSGNATTNQNGVGGLVGILSNGAVITNSCNTGTVTNKDAGAVGGLVGSIYSRSKYKNALQMTNVYNTGTVSAGDSSTESAGGLFGNSDWGCELTDAYGTMTVKRGTAYGGIIAGTVKNAVNAANVYAELIRGKNADCKEAIIDAGDKQLKNVDNRCFNDTEMKPADQLLAKLGDGFAEDVNNINDGYPVLAWQNPAAPAEATITVSVNGVETVLTLPADGSTDASAPTAVEVEYAYDKLSGHMDRIYFKDLPEGAALGTGLNSKDGSLTGELTKLDAGYTGEQLFFYAGATAITKPVKAVWTDDEGAAHYYTITVKRAAPEGYVLDFSMNGMMNESAPYGANTYTAGSEYISAMYAPYAYLALYKDGKNVKAGIAPSFPTDTNGLYYGSGTNIYFARPGRYWVPASVEKDGVTYTGSAPVLVTWTKTALDGYLAQAKALQAEDGYAALPEAMRTQLDAVVTRLCAAGNLDASVMLASDGTIAADSAAATALQARDLGGKQLLAERLLEGDECALLDLMAIIATYKTDETLGQYQMQAYEKLATLGLTSFTDVTTNTERDNYSKYKQARWDVLHAADLDAINAILTPLGLTAVEPITPAGILGDINSDGKVNITDAALLAQYANKVTTLTDDQLAVADVNGDRKVNITDAALLAQYANKVISTFPTQGTK